MGGGEGEKENGEGEWGALTDSYSNQKGKERMLNGDKLWAETWMKSNRNVSLTLVKAFYETTPRYELWEVVGTHMPYDLENPCSGIHSTEMPAGLSLVQLCTRTPCLLIYLVTMLAFMLASLELHTEGLPLRCATFLTAIDLLKNVLLQTPTVFHSLIWDCEQF